MTFATIAAIALGGVLAAGAQTTSRNWTNAQEYDLGSRALAEQDASRQIALLKDWESRYPKTEFERARLVSFALAFQRTGEPKEALARAIEALGSNENDPGVLLLVCTLGPSLPAPSAREKAVVAASARKLLSIPMNGAPTAAEHTQSPATPPDPETQRVIAFIRQLRASRNRAAEKDPELLKRQVAEAALQWAGENQP